MVNSFVDSFNPSQRVPAGMKRRVSKKDSGTTVPGIVDRKQALLVVAGITADPIFDLPLHADGMRRTSIQSWFVSGQLKLRVRPESNANVGMALEKAMKILAADGGKN